MEKEQVEKMSDAGLLTFGEKTKLLEACDSVNHPEHYNQHSMECIDVLRAILTPDEFRGFCLGNMIKYRWRRDGKGNPEQDMAKAEWYLNQLKGTRNED